VIIIRATTIDCAQSAVQELERSAFGKRPISGTASSRLKFLTYSNIEERARQIEENHHQGR
jgi:hypothetical protein